MELIPLNLPDYTNEIRMNFINKTIWDVVRKKHLVFTPEEWVRQNFLQFMINELGYSKNLLAVEMGITLNALKRRCDIVAYNKSMQPRVIVECKAPHIKINQTTFDQIAIYNLQLNVEYLIVTNGLNHYCCRVDVENNTYSFLEHLPKYGDVNC
jgi:hypothetical protein